MNKDSKARVVLGNYQVLKKLGQGAFGEIYLGRNIRDNSEVAIKIDSVHQKNSQLMIESKFILDLTKSKPIGKEINIPNVINIGKEGNCNVMVMDLLGHSLETLFEQCGRHFSLKTTIMIGLELIRLLEFVHSRGLLHRDIKPDNLLIGRKYQMDRIFMIDFGLAKKYLGKEGVHIPYRDNKDLTGTARYASINTHMGIEQGRRDDLETMLYVLIYFFKGSLPWQSMKGQNKKEKYDKIMEKKLTIDLSVLCEGLPPEFQEMLAYVRRLYFNTDPDYRFLSGKLEDIARRENFDISDKDYDWISLWKRERDNSLERERLRQAKLRQ